MPVAFSDALYDIDPEVTAVTQHQFPEALQFGDMNNFTEPNHGLLVYIRLISSMASDRPSSECTS